MKALALPSITRVGHIGSPVTNALAYFFFRVSDEKKSFMALAPGRQFLRSLSGIALFPGMSESPFPFRAAWLKKFENILVICIFIII